MSVGESIEGGLAWSFLVFFHPIQTRIDNDILKKTPLIHIGAVRATYTVFPGVPSRISCLSFGTTA